LSLPLEEDINFQTVYKFSYFCLRARCFLAASASALNAFLMRKHELKEGIEVMDSEGKTVGTSQVAAKNVSVVHSSHGKQLYSVPSNVEVAL
jgi:hypothetical protein